ncbi:MAG TPA: methionyl-tRNA formyltransferase [Ktedonosporobacter sp.]|nr:methionyl-tRNA formyltransferase [Ktedonosporobacter sp.]
MSKNPESLDVQPAPRVLFFGMQGRFSSPALAALLEAGIEVCAVVLPGSPRPKSDLVPIQRREPPTRRTALPLFTGPRKGGNPTGLVGPSIVDIAALHQIPVWQAYRLAHAETVATLAAYQADVICVACFSRLLPRVIIDLPRLGCLNVHPSLLPENRGPVPLFWTFREGNAVTGVTIHLMNEGMDSGDILAQEQIEVPDGISYEQLETRCAALGGTLLARSVWSLYEGRATRTTQDETKSSYHPAPTEAKDFDIDAASWSGRHIYNFIHGVRGVWGPVGVELGSKRWLVRKAISHSHKRLNTYSYEIDENGELIVLCLDGHIVLGGVEDMSDDDDFS